MRNVKQKERLRVKRIRRRQIKQWSAQHEATCKFACTQCDTEIHPASIYERIVFAAGDYHQRLEVERYHISPPCADFYYTAN